MWDILLRIFTNSKRKIDLQTSQYFILKGSIKINYCERKNGNNYILHLYENFKDLLNDLTQTQTSKAKRERNNILKRLKTGRNIDSL